MSAVKAFGSTTKVAIRNDLAAQSCEGGALEVVLLEGTLVWPRRFASSHNNTCDVCVVVDSTLAAPLRRSRFLRLMRRWWTRPTFVFQQAAVPRRSRWSTVFPHTNTFCGERRAPCSPNICFPKWFSYSLTSEPGQGWTTASPPCCDLFPARFSALDC